MSAGKMSYDIYPCASHMVGGLLMAIRPAKCFITFIHVLRTWMGATYGHSAGKMSYDILPYFSNSLSVRRDASLFVITGENSSNSIP